MEWLMASNETLTEMFTGLKEQLDRIEVQVKETNGRVKRLELWQAKLQGAAITAYWIPPVVSAVVAAALVSLFH
jgi:hypothetical protein